MRWLDSRQALALRCGIWRAAAFGFFVGEQVSGLGHYLGLVEASGLKARTMLTWRLRVQKVELATSTIGWRVRVEYGKREDASYEVMLESVARFSEAA